MKPTAYVLFVVALVLAVSAVLLYATPNPDSYGTADAPEKTWSAGALTIALFVAAAVTVALGCVMLRYGGKGYTVTTSSVRR